MMIPLKRKSEIREVMETVLIEALAAKQPIRAAQSDNELEFKSGRMV